MNHEDYIVIKGKESAETFEKQFQRLCQKHKSPNIIRSIPKLEIDQC